MNQTIQLREHPASRALLLLLGGERETLRKSCRFFEVAAVQISGLVILVLCRQTGFTAHASVFVGKPKVKTEPTVGREKNGGQAVVVGHDSQGIMGELSF